MPIYVYECEACELETEALQPIGTNKLACARCGLPTVKQLTCQALVYMKGTPSFRKRYLGTAPYTTRDTSSERVKGGLGAKTAKAKMEGEKWLESIE